MAGMPTVISARSPSLMPPTVQGEDFRSGFESESEFLPAGFRIWVFGGFAKGRPRSGEKISAPDSNSVFVSSYLSLNASHPNIPNKRTKIQCFHMCCTPTSPKRTKCGNLGLMYVTERSCPSRMPEDARTYALAS